MQFLFGENEPIFRHFTHVILRHSDTVRERKESCITHRNIRVIYTRKNKTRTFRINGTFHLK